MTKHTPTRWLTLASIFWLGAFTPAVAAETGQWVAKGSQKSGRLAPVSTSAPAVMPAAATTATPAAGAASATATPAPAAPGTAPTGAVDGQTPVIIYLPPGAQMPANPSGGWVLEGFMKSAQAGKASKSEPPKQLPSPAPAESSTAEGGAKKPTPEFQPPTVTPRIASPVPTLAPPQKARELIEAKPEGGGLFRWPDGMISEYDDAPEPEPTPTPAPAQPKRSKALFGSKNKSDSKATAPTPAQQPKALLARPTPAPEPVATPTPATPPPAGQHPSEDESSRRTASKPKTGLLPSNRPPSRSAVVKSKPATEAQHEPLAETPAAPANEPRSVVVAPAQPPAESSDEKALLPRSVISRYLPGSQGETAKNNGDVEPPQTGWKQYLPADRPSPRSTVNKPAGPPLPPAPNVPQDTTLAPNQKVAKSRLTPSPGTATSRPGQRRGKALFPLSKPADEADSIDESLATEQPAPVAIDQKTGGEKPQVAATQPDPFSAARRLMPQKPRQAKAAPPSLAMQAPLPRVEAPRTQLASTSPSFSDDPAPQKPGDSHRRNKVPYVPPVAGKSIAQRVRELSATGDARVVQQKSMVRPFGLVAQTDNAESPGDDSTTVEASDESLPEPSADRPSHSLAAGHPTPEQRPVESPTDMVSRELAESSSRRPTIVESEPHDQNAVVASDQPPSQAARVRVPSTNVAPRPNPVRSGSVLTSAMAPRVEGDDDEAAEAGAARRTNPFRVSRGLSQHPDNPLR